MTQRIALAIMNLLVGSLCVAAGHMTNAHFNEIIEKTTLEQRKTASVINEVTSTEARIKNYLSVRPHGSRLTY